MYKITSGFKLLLILYSTLLCSGCIMDHYDYRLKVVNQTTAPISVETYLDTIPTYPSVGKAEYYASKKILVGDTTELGKSGKNGWPVSIVNSTNKKVNVFVYSLDSLKKYNNIDSLIKYKIYRKFSFSEDSLKKIHWIVVIKS